jgi:hypothetical protein
MGYYIEAIRAAAEGCEPRELKPMLDFYMEQAQEEYKAGALDVAELGDILNEYTDTLTAANAVNYIYN